MHCILSAIFSNAAARHRMTDDFLQDRALLAQLMASRQDRGELSNDVSPMERALQFQRTLFVCVHHEEYEGDHKAQRSLEE